MGSLGSVFFTEQAVTDYASAKTSDTQKFAEYARFLFQNGIYVAPSQFEAMFVSMAHTPEDLGRTLEVLDRYLML